MGNNHLNYPHVCISLCPGLLLGPVQAVYTTQTKTSAQSTTTWSPQRAAAWLRSPPKSQTHRCSSNSWCFSMSCMVSLEASQFLHFPSSTPLLDTYPILTWVSPAHRRCKRRSRGGEPRREEGKQQAVREMRTPLLWAVILKRRPLMMTGGTAALCLMDRCVHDDLYIYFEFIDSAV